MIILEKKYLQCDTSTCTYVHCNALLHRISIECYFKCPSSNNNFLILDICSYK